MRASLRDNGPSASFRGHGLSVVAVTRLNALRRIGPRQLEGC